MSKTKKTFLLVCILLLGCGAWSVYHLFYSTPFDGNKTVRIYIDTNDNTDSIQSKLRQEGLNAPVTFRLFSLFTEYEKNIKIGAYQFDGESTPFMVFRKLRNGRQTPVNLTVPSVRTIERLAKNLSKRLMTDSTALMQLLSDSSYCASLGFNTTTIPAMFIPNTYEVYWTVSPEAFIKQMHKEYTRFWTTERKQKAEKLGLSPTEVSILASIVEEETAVDREKPIIAGLYLNRLRIDMPLQADPTVKFGLRAFELKRILSEHIKTDTPYNTYLHKGLPPGPIRIPSIVGLESVLNATEHSYLYMCAKEDFSGSHNFASDFGEHLQNATRYRKALDERGIK